jgi:hypothetical protein
MDFRNGILEAADTCRSGENVSYETLQFMQPCTHTIWVFGLEMEVLDLVSWWAGCLFYTWILYGYSNCAASPFSIISSLYACQKLLNCMYIFSTGIISLCVSALE